MVSTQLRTHIQFSLVSHCFRYDFNSTAGRMLTLVNFTSVTLDGLWVTGFMNYGNGGAIYVENSSLTIRNCFFMSNSVYNIGSGASGAAVFAKNSNVNVAYSVFYSHKAKADGGVIYAGSSSNLTITGSWFEDSLSDGQGGFIYFDASQLNSSMSISNTKFLQASAYSGAGIVINGGKSNPTPNTILSSTFAGLSSSTSAASILLQGAKLTMNLSNFINNFAISGASALEAYSSIIVMQSNTFNYTGAPEALISLSSLSDYSSYFGNGGLCVFCCSF